MASTERLCLHLIALLYTLCSASDITHYVYTCDTADTKGTLPLTLGNVQLLWKEQLLGAHPFG